MPIRIQNIIRGLIVFVSCFTLTFIVGSLTLIPSSSHAEVSDSTDVDIELEVNSTITLTVNKSTANFSVIPTPSGVLSTTEVVATVGTNSSTGYTLSMHSKYSDCASPSFCNHLVHTDGTTLIPSTTNLSPNTLQSNTWGFTSEPGDTITSPPVTTFREVPLPGSPFSTINSSTGPVNNDHTITTFGALVTMAQKAGTYEQTVTFTAITEPDPSFPPPSQGLPDPEGAFRFTIDTRMTNTQFAEGDTPTNNPSHFTGTATSFYIPTSGFVGGVYGHSYSWIVNCGGGQSDQTFTGTSAASSNGIACNYPTAGQYQISIKPNGEPTDGWMNAFGFSDSSSGNANNMDNKNRFKSIDTPFTNLMRTRGSTYRFAKMFYGASNAYSMPNNLFFFVSTTGHTNLSYMFDNTFNSYAFNNSTATLPSNMFYFFDTSSATNMSYMFFYTFRYYAYFNPTATIPANLFSSIRTTSAIDLSYMFCDTFTYFAYNNTTGTIPASLFSSLRTTSAIDMEGMFVSTFDNYANKSISGTIPARLFNSIDTSNATNLSYLFDYTFSNYALESTSGTIPAGLFSSISTNSATNVSRMFAGTFYSYARNSTTATIPSGLFSSISPSVATDLSNMFSYTFGDFARNSTSGTIPAGLFSSISTNSATDLSNMFRATFASYARFSTSGTIPAGLFSSINTSGVSSLSYMFNATFSNYAYNNTSGTIPAGLFSSINTSTSTDLSCMFQQTFNQYAYTSTSGTIPSGLFSTINTVSATNLMNTFNQTFYSYAYNSTTATIPSGLFNAINLSSATTLQGLFSNTFGTYAFARTSPGTDINDIWGNANFAGKITAANAGGSSGAFYRTFYNMPSLSGTAQTFITTKLGNISPTSAAQTFRGTGVTDLTSLNANWQ